MSKSKRRTKTADIAAVAYQPPRSHALDIEIFPAATLRNRVTRDFLSMNERIHFHLLIFVTRGRCLHSVDFQSIRCGRGSVIVINPGEIHRFDPGTDWDGWLVMFRPEFLAIPPARVRLEDATPLESTEGLPAHVQVGDPDFQSIVKTVVAMCHDSARWIRRDAGHALLRSQLCTVLIRLHLSSGWNGKLPARSNGVRTFNRYRIAIEDNFRARHAVLFYAKALGCSPKSLTAAVQQCTGMGAKEFLSRRLVLEAKRLLVHTSMPVNAIAETLGFDEGTNFVKFFRRETAMSPGTFRSRQE